jgi:hypothetical protein
MLSPPFGPIEGQKWFFQFSSQSESQNNRFAFIYFSKSGFYLPAFEISHSCRTASADRSNHAYIIIWFGKHVFKMTSGIKTNVFGGKKTIIQWSFLVQNEKKITLVHSRGLLNHVPRPRLQPLNKQFLTASMK